MPVYSRLLSGSPVPYTLEFSKQIKALTFKEKEELHEMMVREGHAVDPPVPAA
jgi:hypothetical protein